MRARKYLSARPLGFDMCDLELIALVDRRRQQEGACDEEAKGAHILRPNCVRAVSVECAHKHTHNTAETRRIK